MYDCQNPDIQECPGSSCRRWGKCQFSKRAIREEGTGWYGKPDVDLDDERNGESR